MGFWENIRTGLQISLEEFYKKLRDTQVTQKVSAGLKTKSGRRNAAAMGIGALAVVVGGAYYLSKDNKKAPTTVDATSDKTTDKDKDTNTSTPNPKKAAVDSAGAGTESESSLVKGEEKPTSTSVASAPAPVVTAYVRNKLEEARKTLEEVNNQISRLQLGVENIKGKMEVLTTHFSSIYNGEDIKEVNRDDLKEQEEDLEIIKGVKKTKLEMVNKYHDLKKELEVKEAELKDILKLRQKLNSNSKDRTDGAKGRAHSVTGPISEGGRSDGGINSIATAPPLNARGGKRVVARKRRVGIRSRPTGGIK